MIVAAQESIGWGQPKSVRIEVRRSFQARACAIDDAQSFNVLSCRIGGVELVHEHQPVSGQAFIDLFPQLEVPEVIAGTFIDLEVVNVSTSSRWFRIAFAGVEHRV